MAQRAIVANDYIVLLESATPGTYNPIICLTSHSFNRVRATIEAKSKCGTITLSGSLTYTLDFAGQIMLDPDAGKVSAVALHALIVANTVKNWKIGPAVPATDDVVYAFSGQLLTYNESFDLDAPGTFTASIAVDGTTVVQTITT